MSAGGGVQVDHDLELILLRPVEGLIQILIAVDIGADVLKEKEGHGDAHGVEAHAGDLLKVALGDELIPVDLQPLADLLGAEFDAEVGLVHRGGAAEEVFAHPLFQDEPVAQVYASQLIHSSLLPYSAAGASVSPWRSASSLRICGICFSTSYL